MFKILLLEVSGVLNCCAGELNNNKLNAESVLLLNQIQRNTGCKIVLNSSWGASEEKVLLLKMHNIDIFDSVVNPPRGSSKGYSIQGWLDGHSSIVGKFVILDSIRDVLRSQLTNLILVNSKLGLRKLQRDIIIERLGRIHTTERHNGSTLKKDVEIGDAIPTIL